jgi:hypothetical protein
MAGPEPGSAALKPASRATSRSGGVDKDVTFVIDTERALNDRIDAAYRNKYRRYGDRVVGGVVNSASRDSTIKLVPR